MIDTHSHIYDPAFDEDREEAIERAKKAGVTKLLLPNVDLNTIRTRKRHTNIIRDTPYAHGNDTRICVNHIQRITPYDMHVLEFPFFSYLCRRFYKNPK